MGVIKMTLMPNICLGLYGFKELSYIHAQLPEFTTKHLLACAITCLVLASVLGIQV